ncbi:uncharacterized protein LOC122144624 [Cyprinus carpio]|uniref:Uncharacterized protein LOC122144624 n=1 Tax=Cyprinus carpio TaxID=7962 RepID=A0A9Q9Y0Y0_CYPCA|nr:uncharacterized protein LOC122144624 [Cyprinus carpio]
MIPPDYVAFQDVFSKQAATHLPPHRNLAEHRHHMTLVLQKLRQHHLFLKLEKSEFHYSMVQFLGYNISPEGIQMDQGKVSAIKEWPIPQSVKELQRFLGFANFYRCFIQDFSLHTAPLTSLLRGKPKSLSWTSTAHEAFEDLKNAFSTAPIPRHPDPESPFVVEVDASTTGILPRRSAQLEPFPSLGRVCTELPPTRYHWPHTLPVHALLPTPSPLNYTRTIGRSSCGLLVPRECGTQPTSTSSAPYGDTRPLLMFDGPPLQFTNAPEPQEPPPPEILEQPSIYQVKEILNLRRRGARLEYLVDWEGYRPEGHSWVARDDILDPMLLEEFHRQPPDRPAPRGRGRPRRRV